MPSDEPRSRRKVLQLGSAVAATAFIAGCGGPGDENGEEPGNGNGVEPENGAEPGNGNGENGDPEANGEPENGEENGNGNDDNGENDENGENGDAIDPDDEIMLGGETQAWMGQEPESIADEENPTLTLEEGESYEITWENLDGVGHNIEIRDDDDEVVDDYETEIIDEEGETQTLEVDEVTDEMAAYVCEPHEGTMHGDIEVE
ncbi:hypothetical protein EA462_03335 [Natrarchaeobius halalkaliphilus]|uniref:Blue (type 1) copper domain-containing protein n=1 Tax=Natrarchaeobius halalkaliphilus TaxID=1679091 RepID=A0A3N6MA92_9EURY|nr:plastocyanin/azurin family copper-binding protein [Natrarchaeobius halalkaliphilus]RQG93240.1 hypothetical protein EA462_03335 [Natrarchaeobius halalkaliphilus]